MQLKKQKKPQTDKHQVISTKVKKQKIEKEIKKVKISSILVKGLIRVLGGKNEPLKAPETAQDSIPYKAIYKDGICQVTKTTFSKTIQFFDITYRLAQNEEKNAIFENYCDFLNYFDSSIKVQMSFINQQANFDEFSKSIHITMQDDEFNQIRKEYAQILKTQLERGNNGLVKTKYITFNIEAENLKDARSRIQRIELDVLNNFKVIGVLAKPLNGVERLEILHNIFNMDSKEAFAFQYQDLVSSGMNTKDFIAPTSFDFRGNKIFKMGKTFGCVSYLQILAPELSDIMLAKFLELDENVIINIHIQSIDQIKAIKNLKKILSDIQKTKIEEQIKAIRSGYDMDILPPDIESYEEDTKNFLNEIESRNEKMFVITFLILNASENRMKLENIAAQTASIATEYNCRLRRLDFMQEQGLMSSLPLGINWTGIDRGLTTSSTAVFIPFTTQELFSESKEALYYGLNALSNNMIMADRKKLKNPNGLILGTPGSGKSFSAKREILNVFLITLDDIIICDPESEYAPLVNALHGQIVKISLSDKYKQYINPMDINLNYSDDENPISLKSDFIISLCELIAGGREGLEGDEISIIDRCVKEVYLNYFQNPIPENMPILQDFYEILKKHENSKANRIATCLEIYVTGSLNVFNHRTNVDISNRIVCFDIKELGKQLKKIGMLIIQDQVWNRVTINREAKKYTRYYVDEFHLLLKNEQTALYSVEIWKRFRKWGGIPTGITQNIKDLLASDEIENIFENSDFIYMLNQAPKDGKLLAKSLNISSHQLAYVTRSGEGEGLIMFGNVLIPFVDKYPEDTKTYEIMTTKLTE